ncbi:putative glycolipid-binding domain-containing protein [Mesorhizobium xinjiangense]|uniref:putative glycolipid-binding domain-containing protein n=1 Tax=Mesorhizobium xinjiangense TaxID=2678685 RepID=UPI0012EE6076|nr:putative glycolipid-binding domain-containing protein [Mesorhizobium xinjiangense]
MDATDTRVVRWREVEGGGLEHLVMAARGDAILFDGVVIPGGQDYAVEYHIACTANWRVERVEAAIIGGQGSLLLEHDGRGHWKRNGRAAPSLDGVFEPDLSVSPLTNTFPIRRLGLSQGESADIRTAYVSFPDFAVFADPQRYTCLEENRLYRYESRDSDFCRDIEVDADGFVIDYPGLFRRME